VIATDEIPHPRRAGTARRTALRAVANTGHGSDVPERFRAIIYTTGITSHFAPEMARLRNYVEGRYWILSGTYFDKDDTTPASARPGLLEALTSIRLSDATALVTDKESYEALPPDAREWLESEVAQHGGFITPVSRPSAI